MISGPRLFNQFPKNLREFPNKYEDKPQLAVDSFKKQLDKYLEKIPDEPNLSGEYSRRIQGVNNLGQKTNSIIRIN